MKKISTFILLLIAMMAIIGVVGSYEFASEIVYGLTEAQYDSIVKDIGTTSERQVAKQYLDNKKRYDSIK